ncbi:uncharacterized protein LOC103493594 isoform X2 [Cucumis melo]|uniref:Uncharacterized protein LOC103493594 isoform X2 n=1 Tax=Cucumis melo TaxID=3656 RepID=A0ABM3L1C8_CUCME|nr:uncharacterized protein LOC103493594 isoform X2 [Cucumis melo]XP_050943835.1 uncharacterized protein LOC103493594 isoform X2 [Cucumis melo]
MPLQLPFRTFFAFSSSEMAPNNLHVESNEYLFATPSNRKMKLQDSEQRKTRKNVRVGDVNLYDYHPIDPVPSSKRSIKHGPIEHGSPLIPHMPNPSPPDQPQPGGFV